jgi:hypothetical protein
MMSNSPKKIQFPWQLVYSSGRYNWNIVESGILYHNPNPTVLVIWLKQNVSYFTVVCTSNFPTIQLLASFSVGQFLFWRHWLAVLFSLQIYERFNNTLFMLVFRHLLGRFCIITRLILVMCELSHNLA